MADVISYRRAVPEGIARAMRADPMVVCIGEDIGAAGGPFKTMSGLFDEFGPDRVWDTPIAEQAFLGAALGAAMTGLRPVVDLMFSDFLACCWDFVANEIPKVRYMTGGQVGAPLVIKSTNGGGIGFGAQHSQAIENWAACIPGLKVVAPATPADATGLMVAAIQSDDPVLYFEHKALLATKGEAAAPDLVVPLGQAAVRRTGADITLVGLAATVSTCTEAAQVLEGERIHAEVIDLRGLIPLDTACVLASVAKTGRLLVVEENPWPGGWGATLVAVVADEAFGDLRAPTKRVAAPYVPIPAGTALEAGYLPDVGTVAATARSMVSGRFR
jgi:acetoin:2,6-dichlorophenolindophenol oxidoreductase subunit beta